MPHVKTHVGNSGICDVGCPQTTGVVHIPREFNCGTSLAYSLGLILFMTTP